MKVVMLLLFIVCLCVNCKPKKNDYSFLTDIGKKTNIILRENEEFVYSSRPDFIKIETTNVFVIARTGNAILKHDINSGNILEFIQPEDLDLLGIVKNFMSVCQNEFDYKILTNSFFIRSLKFTCFVESDISNKLFIVLTFNYPELGEYILDGVRKTAQYWKYAFSILEFDQSLNLISYKGIKSDNKESIFTNHNYWISRGDTLLIPMQFQLKGTQVLSAARYIYSQIDGKYLKNEEYFLDSVKVENQCNLLIAERKFFYISLSFDDKLLSFGKNIYKCKKLCFPVKNHIKYSVGENIGEFSIVNSILYFEKILKNPNDSNEMLEIYSLFVKNGIEKREFILGKKFRNSRPFIVNSGIYFVSKYKNGPCRLKFQPILS